MSDLSSLFNDLFTLFDLRYTFANVISIYIYIKVLENILKNKFHNYDLSTNWKKVLTFCLSVINAIIWKVIVDAEVSILICSALLSVVAYDYIIKVLIKKLNIK